MNRFLSGSEFGWKVAWPIGIFLAFTIGFPFIIYGIILATGAQRVGGASGAVAVVAGIYLKPIIIAVFLLSMMSPCWKRMRTLGIFPLWGLLIPLLLAMNYTYLFSAGNFWGANFSAGILMVQMPFDALTALVLVLAMALAVPPSNDAPKGMSRFGAAQALAAVAIAVLVVGLVTSAYSLWSFWMLFFGRVEQLIPINRVASQYLSVFWKAHPYLCLALSVMSLWVAFVSRRNSGGEASQPPGATPIPVPVNSIASPPGAFGKR